VDAPFKVVHADVYKPGDTQSFDGPRSLMVVMDHMSTFVIVEPLPNELNSTTFAKALYKVLLQFGLAHTCVVDADSKFQAEFTETLKLLKIHRYPLARGNHNGMLVERFNRFLNDSLTIFLNDRGTNRTFLEGSYLAAYAWNSAPVVGTDMSRSLVAIGRELSFPIDFVSSSSRVFSETVDPSVVTSYSKDMLALLEKCQEVYRILIAEHRAMHRELRNSQLPAPFRFNIGDIVLAKKQVKSIASIGRVAKLEYEVNGPWKVITVLPGGSYQLESLTSTKQIRKKGGELYLCPLHVVPFKPLEGSDFSYGTINKELTEDPYQSIGINGFEPLTIQHREPIVAPAAHTRTVDTVFNFHNNVSFPSLDDLDKEYAELITQQNIPPPHSMDTPSEVLKHAPKRRSTLFTGQPPTPSELGAALVASEDKLVFINFKLPTSDFKEWRIVKVLFEKSCSLQPSCLATGRYLCNFLVCHQEDRGFDAINQRYWTEYHEKLSATDLGALIHLVRPPNDTTGYLSSMNLVPFQLWINLCHEEVFLHGPFDFAMYSRKSRDRISRHDWDALISLKASGKYSNPIPSLDSKNDWAFHIDVPFHSAQSDRRIAKAVSYYYSESTAVKDVDVLACFTSHLI
jgi:hypothetical protein